MRGLILLAVAGLLVSGFAACALDESGTSADSGIDVMTQDVTVDQTIDSPADVVVDVQDSGPVSDASDGAVTCVLDASCLPAFPTDAGWTVLGLSVDASACAFSSGTFLVDASIAPGACNCGCTTTGTSTCTGNVVFTGYSDPICSMPVVDGAVPTGMGCVNVGDLLPDAGVSVEPPTATGVTCDASVTGSKSVVASSLSTCEPLNCNDDFCGMKKKGYRLCIAHPSPTSCPAQFPIEISAVATANVSCNGCTCGVTTPQCTGTVSTFAEAGCEGGAVTTMAAGAACSPLTSETFSVSYAPNAPPSIGCTAGSLGGTLSTLGDTVICCIP